MALQSAREEHERSLAQVHDASIISDSRCEELMQEMSSIREDHSVERSSLLQCNQDVLESLQKVTERMDDIVTKANATHDPAHVLSKLQAEQYFSRLSNEVRELRAVQSETVDSIAANGHETTHHDVVALSTQFNVTIKSLVDGLHKASQIQAVQSNRPDTAGPVVPLDRLESALFAQQELQSELMRCKQDLQQAHAQVQAQANFSTTSAINASEQVHALQAENDALHKQLAEAEAEAASASADGGRMLAVDASVQMHDETGSPSDSQMEQVESEVQRQLDRLQAELGQAEERARAAQQQANANDASIVAAAAVHELQVSQLRSELRDKEEQLHALQKQCSHESAARSEAAREHERALQAVSAAGDEALQRAQVKFLAEIARSEERARDAEDKCRGLAEEVATLRAKHAAATAELTLATATLSRARTQLQEEQRRCATLVDQVAALGASEEASLLKARSLQQETASLQAQLDAQRVSLQETAAQELRETAQRLQHTGEHVAELQAHVQDLETELDSERRTHRKERSDLRCELEAANAKGRSYSNSLLQLQAQMRRADTSNAATSMGAHTSNGGPNMSSAEAVSTSALYPVVTQLLSAVSHHAAADGYGQ